MALFFYMSLFGPLILGPIFTYIAYYALKKRTSALTKGCRTEGVICIAEKRHALSGKNKKVTTVRFLTEDQGWIQKDAPDHVTFMKDGDKVQVIYNPSDPGDFVIQGPQVPVFFLYTLVGIGAFLSLWGIGQFIYYYCYGQEIDNP
ncbi:MAG: DUF3592 domain-containing protein [Chitinophagaceae bacterium]